MISLSLGEINGHVVGRVLKEAVRRAMVAIRAERTIFEATAKAGHSGTMDDVFTSADTKAQDIYLRTLRECFPHCGIIAEEDSLRIDPTGDCTAYFTVDPLDGTKAFVRRQSHGVGTMIALIDQGEVISAYIGDINTEEVYGYRPGSEKVHRITRLDTFEQLGFHRSWDDGNQYALLRDPLKAYSGPIAETLNGCFHSHQIDGGSIGIWMARLWKREVSAVFLPEGYETPWDAAPLIGISRMLRYQYLRPTPDNKRWECFDPPVTASKYLRRHDTLIIHDSDLTSLAHILFA